MGTGKTEFSPKTLVVRESLRNVLSGERQGLKESEEKPEYRNVLLRWGGGEVLRLAIIVFYGSPFKNA